MRRDQTSDYPLYGTCLVDGRWTNDARVPSYGLNVHRGRANTTGSQGCQTIYKPRWESFIATVKMEMQRYDQKVIRYFLTDGTPVIP